MKKLIALFGLSLLIMCCLPSKGITQAIDPSNIAERYLTQNKAKWQLTQDDIKNLYLSDHYTSKHSGITHIYFTQTYQEIRVYNAIAGIHITSEGNVAFATNTFIPDLASKINTSTPEISAFQAIQLAAAHTGSGRHQVHLIKTLSSQEYLFDGGSISNSDIRVKLKFHPIQSTGKVRLSWQLMIDSKDSPDMWNIHVDAVTGAIIEQNDLTLYCNFSTDGTLQDDDDCTEVAIPYSPQAKNFNFTEGSYNVFPLPTESPIHGDREWVIDPHDTAASPFGWHDTDGQAGAEYEITRGNNAHAYLDTEENDASTGDEPQGGSGLIFDFPFDPLLQPEANQEAAITQLFYTVNYIHDFSFHYGFDEAAGNFQTTNYSGEGYGSDPVNAEGQDGNGTNNSNFSTPADGAPGRMQMYLWNSPGGQLLNVLEPTSISGLYNTGHAIYGPPLTTEPIIGELVEAFDNSNNPSLGCGTIINADEVNGKIALIDRGDCVFERKTLNAEAAGAIAVIICNYQQGTTTMGGSFSTEEPTIPTIIVEQSACQVFRQLIEEGITVSLGVQDDGTPNVLDGCFDNGVIIHEYGHGISNRLTGGPAQEACLFNDEQMGEGWSDFFTLVSTVKPGDSGTTPRGIGNYVNKSGVNGSGIRRLPYSTNMNINNQTYDDIIGTDKPHPLGEIWTDVLWDLYWAMVDVYGFDEDQTTGSGGNNMAIQLVMDGMKYQPCNPGFIDGRNAILAADDILFDGANACLIWEVFARRGLGYDADQGSVFDRNDGFPGFEVLPECIKELKIAKEVTPIINAGDEITVTLTVRNHKEGTVSGIIVNDEIPEGAEFINGSATGATVEILDNMLSFAIGDLPPGDSRTISYKLSTSITLFSQSQFLDDVEDGDGKWVFDNLTGTAIWNISGADPHSGSYSWFVPDTEERNDQVLYFFDPFPVYGNQPVLRFFHKYDTEPGTDGGYVDISVDGGESWEKVSAQVFRNPYRGGIAFLTFSQTNVDAFWGQNLEYKESYIDLSPFLGEYILVRFRFGSDGEEAGQTEDGTGWYVDDIEITDMFNYHTEACLYSDEGDVVCAFADGRGTVVNAGDPNPVQETLDNNHYAIFPNPAGEVVNVDFNLNRNASMTFEIISGDGRVLSREAGDFNPGSHHMALNISALPQGIYFIKICSGNELFTEKILVK
ncbi:MAG: T9SS-dependent M36 family metallopeptidase [Saprospiraceae bacterium]|nr:T9SS-dependent M36 family metallopeptidase [Saprospiraceae bacterium]MCB9324845.1 T9SS-dependent M36 family metallopeptidase [Lewinellaceae bacterium]